MEIKSSRRPSPLLDRLRKISRLPGIIRWGILIIVGFVCLGAFFLASVRYGMDLHKFGDASSMSDLVRQISETRLRVIPNYIQGLSAQPPLLKLDVKFTNLQKLGYDRAKAIEAQIMLSDSLNVVNATLTYGDNPMPAKLRLKGDWTCDNLQGDKWSFRLRLRGDRTLFGMKQFSLHHPRVRNYVYEWLFHKMLEKEGVLPLRYMFVRLSLNGKDLGIYALEEHFEKRLIEHNRDREGPILKFDENPRWKAVRESWPQNTYLGLSSLFSASIDAFSTGAILEDSTLYAQFMLAESLLERFRSKELPASAVFDAKKLAAFFAVVDLMGAQHALSWHNLRFYYNPVNSRLEPIGFDGNAGTRTVCLNGLMKGAGFETNPFQDLVLDDPVVFSEYVACLERMADPAYLKTFLAEHDKEIQDNLGIIYSEFPEFNYSPVILQKNRETIAESLDPIKGIHAYLSKTEGSVLTLQIGNIQSWPIEIRALSLADGSLIAPDTKPVLKPHAPSRPVSFSTISFRLPKDIQLEDSLRNKLAVQYAVLGSSVNRMTDVFPHPLIDEEIVQSDFLRQPPNIRDFKFIGVDQATRTISMKPGTWIIRKSVIIPPGYRVICSGGTTLSLEKGSRILSHSPLFFAGKKEAKIIVRSEDLTGQGLAVFETSERSLLEHVIFENLTNPTQGGWSLTGAVTFYKADVSFASCVFRSNQCEDFVNVIRADVSIDDCLFTDVFSDAFDGDFCTGHYTNVAFVNIGNDALDVSGSTIDIQGMSVTGAGDKGISLGENSHATVSDVEIKDSEIGIAIKDLSGADLTDIDITNTKVGFVLFQKKPEYGPARATVAQLVTKDIHVLDLVERGSELVIDGRRIDNYRDDVEAMLYGIVFGKSSHETK